MVFSNKPLQFLFAALVAFFPLFSNANTSDTLPVKQEVVAVAATAETKVLSEDEKKDEERKEFIQHHLLDSHDFHLFSYGKETGHETHIGFPLPVILWEDGLHFFMSSEFHHGEAVAKSNGKYFKINHHDGMIYNTDAKGTFNVDEKHHTTNTKPIDFSITKIVSIHSCDYLYKMKCNIFC